MNMQTSNVMAPPAPKTLAQMKLPLAMMRDILLKTMFRRNETLVTELAKTICLPVPVVQELVDLARSQLLLEATGTMSAGSGNEMGYQLTDAGKARSLDALVPRAIEYSGQVITVYDPIVHSAAEEQSDDPNALRRTSGRYDTRYVRCERPTVITGGELSLSMLDLVYNKTARTYQAPLQLKSTGGIFIVDDLGRQAEPPQALVNRWIVPLEENKDILALQSGEKFEVPFDTLVIFSTNFHPNEIFDRAALRRIFYKIKIDGPNQEDFLKIFAMMARKRKMPLDEAALIHLLNNRYPEIDNVYANYQPIFLIDQMIAICEFEAIGVAGCGRMGLPMLQNLQAAGFNARGFDVCDVGVGTDPDAFADGLTTLITVVRDADETDALLFDVQRLAHAPSLHTIIISSTLSPNFVKGLRNRVPPHIRLIDAPMSGAQLLTLINASSGQNWLASGFDEIEFARDGFADDNSIGILFKDVAAALDIAPDGADTDLPNTVQQAIKSLKPRA